MLTLYHSPNSRATRALQLVKELDALEDVKIEHVIISRADGSDGPDPGNPHPDGKVPTLVHDGEEIWESPAIFLYLTELFPKAKLGPLPGEEGRGRYLSWLAWYGDVMEPVMHFTMMDIDHPGLKRTFRGKPELDARLIKALQKSPYLLGESYSAADLLIASTFAWMEQLTPDNTAVRDWVARCADRPAAKWAQDYEAKLLAK